MSLVQCILSNSLILSVLRKYLERENWSYFLISLCNPITGAVDLCVSLGLVAYLEQLDNPLTDGWNYDERENIITI